MGKKKTDSKERRGRVNRGLKPRSRDTYTNEQYGRQDSSLPPDDLTINERCCRVNLLRPRYNEGIMVFRAWPALLPEDPENMLENGRVTPNDRGQGNWIRRMPTADYIGLPDGDCEKATFILYRPGDKPARQRNPYRLFYFACKAANDAGEFGNGRAWDSKWNKLMKGSKKGGAAIQRPKNRWFIQGEVYVNGDKDYMEDRELPLGADEDDDLTIIQLPDSGGENIMGLLDVRKKVWDGDEEAIPSLPFVYGDPCGIFDPEAGVVNGGLLMTIFNPKKVKSIKKHTSWDGKIADVQGYEAAVAKSFKHDGEVYRADLDAERTLRVFEKWQFWMPDPDQEDPDPADGILYVMPEEEQCLRIARAFKKIPKLLRFAWADHPEFFTEEVKAVLAERVTAAMPGSDDEDLEPDEDDGLGEDDEFEEAAEPAKDKKKRRTKKDVTATPTADDDDEFDEAEDVEESGEAEEGDDEFESDETEEGEAEAEEGDDEFDEDEGEAEEVDDEEGDGEDEFDADADGEPEDEGEAEAEEGGDDDEFTEDEEGGGDEDGEGEELDESEYFQDDDPGDEDDGEGEDEFEEDNSDSDEFNPEEEASQKEQEMEKSMEKATGRSGKRTSTKKSAPTKKGASTKKKTVAPKEDKAAAMPKGTSTKKKGTSTKKKGPSAKKSPPTKKSSGGTASRRKKSS